MRHQMMTSSAGESPMRNSSVESPEGPPDESLNPSPGSSGHGELSAEFRADAHRISSSRVKSEFEHALLSCLLFNVLYMYYVDHRLIVLFIRMSQIVRLLYFPHESRVAQRSTSLLLFMSNIPVLLIHGAVFAEGKVGDMLLINFIGPEPHVLAKLFYIDVLTIFLQSILASTAAGDSSIVTKFPVLVSQEQTSREDAQSSNVDESASSQPTSHPQSESRETVSQLEQPSP